MGARVKFCGHDGWFVADVHRVGNVNVVVANGPVKASNINRKSLETITHEMVDYPSGGYWGEHRGIFVIPEDQVTEVKHAERA